ncbi:hypothetical protein MNBD_ALPHA09-1178 [hydrothermal vent metagenome]|uniref:Uncharacterized protein n=1 Tax=hydrothermal vent metagenome TaxID=652676 RepID=A0A3B0TDE3_9ZZZZ
MNIVSMAGGKAREFTTGASSVKRVFLGLAVGLAVGLSGAATAQAQEFFDGRQSIYIDGSTPVDARTKALVDAYFDEIRNRQEAKAEERERFNRFIYHDNIVGAQQFGRW